jgi:predicted neuraminidase
MVKLLQEWISDEGADGKACHASSVTELPDGRIAAAWFAGTNEKNPDVDIAVGNQGATDRGFRGLT